MLTAIIIEDESTSRETLQNFLAIYCKDVKVIAEASNIKEGLKLINLHHPQMVFLDIEMPFGNAFDLLEQLEEINFDIVFVTAYSEYAVKALNFSASYYILKPIDIDELIKAVEKVKVSSMKEKQLIHTKVLMENMKIENKQLQKVVLPIIDGFEVVRVKDIVRCEAEDNYTCFYYMDGKKQLICKTLKYYEQLLSDYDFIRVHKSHLVNFQYIRQYKKGKGGLIILEDGSHVNVSPAKKAELMIRFK